MKLCITSVAIIAFAISSNAQELEKNSYYRINTGLGLRPQTSVKINGIKAGSAKSKPGVFAEIAYGISMPKQIDNNVMRFIRPEIALRYQYNDIDSVDSGGSSYSVDDTKIEEASAFMNLFFDFENDSPGTFFIGGGIGAAFASVDTYGENLSDVVPEFHFGTGIGYKMSETLRVDLSYNYYIASNISDSFTIDDTTGEQAKAKADLISHNIGIGIRSTF